jgi:hypothetical protein
MPAGTLVELRPMPSSRGAEQEADYTTVVFFEDSSGNPLPFPQKGDRIRLDDERWGALGNGRVYMVDQVEWGLSPVAAPAPRPTSIVALRLS